METKSICIVSSQYFPHLGGVEQYIDNFARELVSRGHNVTIVTSEIAGVPDYEKDGLLEIYRLPSIPLMAGRFPVLKLNKKTRKFTKELKAKKFDIMLVNMRFYFISLYAVRLAKKMKVRCIMLDHGTSHLNTGGKLTTKLGEWFEHCITWLEKRYCKEFAGVSKATLEWIQHFNIKSDTVLYNAINLEHFESMKSNVKRDFREELQIPKDDIVISFVGRLTVEKGIRELVTAVTRLNETNKNVWLVAAGEGYLKDEMLKIKSDNVKLVGKLPIEDVVAMLMQSQILCLPSVSEGFPTTVLEAAICKNFVITTYRGGAREIITGDEYGIILPDNNTNGLYNAIADVINKKDYMENAKELCYKRVAENYTWKQTVDKFLSLL